MKRHHAYALAVSAYVVGAACGLFSGRRSGIKIGHKQYADVMF